MRWRFGGDFEPVLTTCAFNWLECPFALTDYIWSEVVTDVAECLVNESILWRILALLLICTTVVHLIYWQIRWTKEIQMNNRNLKQVDNKVQDLELKLNILTYKTQYGILQLSGLPKANAKGDSPQKKIGFSKFCKQNSWIKNLLTKKKINGSTKSNYSLGYQTYLDTEISQTEFDFSDNNLSTDIMLFSNTLAPPWKGNIVKSSHNETKVKHDTRKTLYEVKRRLENLHTSLKRYTLRNWSVMTHNNAFQGRSNNSLSSRKCKSKYGSSIDLRRNVKKHSVPHLSTMYAACNAMLLNRDQNLEFASYRSSDGFSPMAKSTECSVHETCVNKKVDESKICDLSKELSSYKKGVKESKKGKISDHSKKIEVKEPLKENDSDGKSTSVLIEEALIIKKEILSQIEAQKEHRNELQKCNTDDVSNDYNHNKNKETSLESKMLDMISEESSDTSLKKRNNIIRKYKALNDSISLKKTNIETGIECNREGNKNAFVFIENEPSANESVLVDKINFSSNEIQNFNVSNDNRNTPENLNTNNQTNKKSIVKVDSENKITSESLNLVNESNSNKLIDTSSEASVNRLINRLIQSERKHKSAHTLSNTNSIINDNRQSKSADNLDYVSLSMNVKNHPTPNGEINESTKTVTNSITNVNTDNLPIECMKNNIESDLKLEKDKTIAYSADEKGSIELLMFENNNFQSVIDTDKSNMKENSFHCSDNSFTKTQSIQNVNTMSFKNLDTIERKCSSIGNNEISIQLNNLTSKSDELQNVHYSTSLRNIDCFNETQKSISTNALQKQIVKNVVDVKINRQIREKSNLNSSSVDKYGVSTMFRRSKSYVPCENSVIRKCNTDSAKSFESFTSSSKSSSLWPTPREFKNQDNVFQEEKKQYFGSFDIPSDSSLKPSTEIQTISEIKRNNTFLLSGLSKSNSLELPKGPIKDQNFIHSTNSLTSSSKSSSKSCIQISKNSLEFPIHKVGETLSNPIQGSLAIMLGSYMEENDKLISDLQTSNNHKQETTFHGDEIDETHRITCNVINPNQLLHRVKNDEIERKSTVNEEKQNISTINKNSHLMIWANSKVTSLIPSFENIDFTDVSSFGSSSHQLQNKLQSLPYKVYSKETEVLVKPSMLDISTSVTDLPSTFHKIVNNEINRLKIFEIPEELSREDYISLVQVVKKNAVFGQLSNTEKSLNNTELEQ